MKPRADRITALAVMARQQTQLQRATHAAIKEYLALVADAVGHTTIAIRADASSPDVNLNALDQSAAWPAILNRRVLPVIRDLIGKIGPPDGYPLSTAAQSSIAAWRTAWLAARTQALAGVPEQITKQIRDAIADDAAAAGPNPAKAASIVKDLLNPDAPTWKSRAMTIARTEVIGANNQGGLASWTAVHQSLGATGGQVLKTWLATEDEKTRPDHADADGTEIPISGTFSVGGDEMTGPGDENADPSQTVNCRCTLTYRVDDAEDALAADGRADHRPVTAATEAPVTTPSSAASLPYEPQPYSKGADETVQCPNCQLYDDTDAVYCDQCGQKFADAPADPYTAGADETITCPNDQSMNDVDARFCDQCGFQLIGSTEVTAMTAAGPPTITDTPAAPAGSTDGPELAPADPFQPGTQWAGPLAPVDTPSADGRMASSAGAIIRELPLPLSFQLESSHGGAEAGTTVVVGRILTCSIEGGLVVASGDWLDPGANFQVADAIQAAAQRVQQGLGMVSIDTAPLVVGYAAKQPDGSLVEVDPMLWDGDPDSLIMVMSEWELMGATLVADPAFGTARIAAVEGAAMPGESDQIAVPMMPDDGSDPGRFDAASPQPPVVTADSVTFPDGTVLKVGDQVNIIDALGSDAPSTGLIESINTADKTVTVAVEDPTTPGKTNSMDIAVANLEPATDDSSTDTSGDTGANIQAAGTPHAYPAEWFEPVTLDGPTGLTVTDDGRVYGHLATFGVCHTGFADQCVTAPSSASGYSYFHLGEADTSAGPLAVGKLTVGGGHANAKMGWQGTVEHYDNAGAVVAVVRAHEDEYGIQVTGGVVPTATTDQVAALKRSPLSGDWRRIGGNLELVAALGVSVPGFPVPRAALAASGQQLSLVAAGVVHAEASEEDPQRAGGISLPSGVKLTSVDLAVLASAFDEAAGKRSRREQDARRLKRQLTDRARASLRAKLTAAG